jgi:shikimate dehydrogenase
LVEAGTPRVGGATHTVGIIGWPVAHSLSPAVHNAAFAALAMDWIYVPLPVSPPDLPAALDGLAPLGFAGANITMPHKTFSAARADSLSDDARRLRAVNTLVVEGDELHGHNTDAPGFDRFLRKDTEFRPPGRSALLYGAGGAARAVALALARDGLAELTVAVRDPAAAAGLVGALDGLATAVQVILFGDAQATRPHLIVNATPAGADGAAFPTPQLGPDQTAIDLQYGAAPTTLLIRAREAGASAFGGLGLLLHQAALTFELWTGVEPPFEVMSAAALAEIARRRPAR